MLCFDVALRCLDTRHPRILDDHMGLGHARPSGRPTRPGQFGKGLNRAPRIQKTPIGLPNPNRIISYLDTGNQSTDFFSPYFISIDP